MTMTRKQVGLGKFFIDEIEFALKRGDAKQRRYAASDESGEYVRLIEWNDRFYLHQFSSFDRLHIVAEVPRNRINETGVFPYGFQGIIIPELTVEA